MADSIWFGRIYHWITWFFFSSFVFFHDRDTQWLEKPVIFFLFENATRGCGNIQQKGPQQKKKQWCTRCREGGGSLTWWYMPLHLLLSQCLPVQGWFWLWVGGHLGGTLPLQCPERWPTSTLLGDLFRGHHVGVLSADFREVILIFFPFSPFSRDIHVRLRIESFRRVRFNLTVY